MSKALETMIMIPIKIKDPHTTGLSPREKAIFNACKELFLTNLEDTRNNNLDRSKREKLLNEFLFELKKNLTSIVKQYQGCHISTVRRMMERSADKIEGR